MADKLNADILGILKKRLGKTPEKIRPRLSELRRKHSGLTPNAAAQMYAESHGTSIMPKLDPEDRRSLASVQTITQVSSTKNLKIDKRTLNITNSPIHNLSFGDRSTVNQSVVSLDASLSELFEKIEGTTKLSPEAKSDYKSDVEALASQIGKTKPNRSIIGAAWKTIQGLADIEGFAQLITQITPMVHTLLATKPF